MPTLSVVMIVKNEAACLEDCLNSVRPIADEIVIGDTGSTDDTKAVAERNGAWVFDVPWTNDFAAARNAVNRRAHGAWLLHMDADEVLDPGGAERLRAFASAGGDGPDAVEVILANYCQDARSWRWVPSRPGDPYARGFPGYLPAPLLRLYRNDPRFEYREAVHENITESVLEAGGVIQRTQILIHHYGYEENPDNGRGKSRFYYELAKAKTETLPQSAKAWYDLAEAAWACREDEVAERACRAVIEREPRHYGASLCLAKLLIAASRDAEAQTMLEDMLAAGYETAPVLLALAAVEMRRGDDPAALRALHRAASAKGNTVPVHIAACRVLERMGDAAGANAQLDAVAHKAPGLSGYVGELREALSLRRRGEETFGQGDAVGALRLFAAAAKLDPNEPLIHNDLGVCFTVLGEMRRARESFERALQLAPGYAEARDNLRDLDAVSPE